MIYCNSKPNPQDGADLISSMVVSHDHCRNGAEYIINGAGKQHFLGGIIHVRGQDPDLP